MSTNFYTLDGKHIGKRWAAGTYCWDCRVPALRLRADGVAVGRAEQERNFRNAMDFLFGRAPKEGPIAWMEPRRYRCPQCAQEGDGTFNPADRELGFDKSEPREHHGIDGASGFHWYTGDNGLGDSIPAVSAALARRTWVVDEYGRRVSILDFRKIMRDVVTEDASTEEFS